MVAAMGGDGHCSDSECRCNHSECNCNAPGMPLQRLGTQVQRVGMPVLRVVRVGAVTRNAGATTRNAGVESRDASPETGVTHVSGLKCYLSTRPFISVRGSALLHCLPPTHRNTQPNAECCAEDRRYDHGPFG